MEKQSQESASKEEVSAGEESHDSSRRSTKKDSAEEHKIKAHLEGHLEGQPKIPHKFIANWRQACDRTKDRTKELLKRWRTLPELETGSTGRHMKKPLEKIDSRADGCGWSVHVWTTWVDRFSINNSSEEQDKEPDASLSQVQRDKFIYFFDQLLDHDRDELISYDDFEMLSQKLRHFADWSVNSSEFNILREVQTGFADTFMDDADDSDAAGKKFISRSGWLHKWAKIVGEAYRFSDFPLWLQYLARVLFQVINKSGSGIVTKNELSAFFSSVMGYDPRSVPGITEASYRAMTSNGDHGLNYHAYRLCFANFVLAKHPNGPGQHVLGMPARPTEETAMFPVDYSALNALPEELEQYKQDNSTTSRHSVVV